MRYRAYADVVGRAPWARNRPDGSLFAFNGQIWVGRELLRQLFPGETSHPVASRRPVHGTSAAGPVTYDGGIVNKVTLYLTFYCDIVKLACSGPADI